MQPEHCFKLRLLFSSELAALSQRVDGQWFDGSDYGFFSELPEEISVSNDKVAAFGGTLAEFYDRYLVPLM